MDDRRLLGVHLGIIERTLGFLVGLFGELNLPNQVVNHNLH